MDKSTSNLIAWIGKGITTFGGLLAFIMFFMPWALVSCGGTEVGTITGWQLATGSGPLENSGAKAPVLFVTWFLILLAIVVAFAVPKKTIAGAVNIILPFIMFLIVMLVYAKLRSDVQQETGSVIQIHQRAGLVGTFIGYFLIFLGGLVELGAGLAGGDRRSTASAGMGFGGAGMRNWIDNAFSPPEVMGAAPPPAAQYPPADETAIMHGASASLPTATLVIRSGPWAGRRIPVQGDNILIGRGSQGCQICIPDKYISRRHARLRFANGQWFIQDQQSRGGTFVNGQRVGAIRLNNNDVIRLGQTEMIFTV